MWVSPTSHNDVDGDWSNEANAYDDDTATFASCAVNTQYLELLLDSPISCRKVRSYVSTAGVSLSGKIQVWDVDAGSWIVVKPISPGHERFTLDESVEDDVPGAPLNVSKARICWTISVGGTGQLNEFEFEAMQGFVG